MLSTELSLHFDYITASGVHLYTEKKFLVQNSNITMLTWAKTITASCHKPPELRTVIINK